MNQPRPGRDAHGQPRCQPDCPRFAPSANDPAHPCYMQDQGELCQAQLQIDQHQPGPRTTPAPRSVLTRSSEPPSAQGLLPMEIEACVPCSCGHRLVPRDGGAHSWYWQHHSVNLCTLQLPDEICWCGRRRSEHVDGHAPGAHPVTE
jgi:hypothetical protein